MRNLGGGLLINLRFGDNTFEDAGGWPDDDVFVAFGERGGLCVDFCDAQFGEEIGDGADDNFFTCGFGAIFGGPLLFFAEVVTGG